MSLEITIKSGVIVGADNIQDRIMWAAREAIRVGEMKTRAIMHPKIPVDLGTLERTTVETLEAKLAQLTQTLDKVIFSFSIYDIPLVFILYAKYHLPQLMAEWNALLLSNTQAAIPNEMTKQGLEAF